MSKPVVYIGCSVTNSSKELEAFVAEFKQRLRLATETIVLEWIGKNPDLQLEHFYKTDFNNVRSCDLMIAIADEPSIGLGMEIQYAISAKRPLLCLTRRDIAISRLLQSAADEGVVPVMQYSTIDEAINMATEFIARHQKAAA